MKDDKQDAREAEKSMEQLAKESAEERGKALYRHKLPGGRTGKDVPAVLRGIGMASCGMEDGALVWFAPGAIR